MTRMDWWIRFIWSAGFLAAVAWDYLRASDWPTRQWCAGNRVDKARKYQDFAQVARLLAWSAWVFSAALVWSHPEPSACLACAGLLGVVASALLERKFLRVGR
ncbi:MAG: hypothetical protein J0H02_17430 [Armatimonadetes bacterium]|nr:hypothetical protein [Armatimonadota bacterium]